MARKIKMLKWQYVCRDKGRESCKSQTPLGEFWACEVHGQFKVLRRHVWDNDFQDDVLSSHTTWKAAKQAAQKHYEKLISRLLK